MDIQSIGKLVTTGDNLKIASLPRNPINTFYIGPKETTMHGINDIFLRIIIRQEKIIAELTMMMVGLHCQFHSVTFDDF